jgi:hypothetical protein
MPDQPTTPGRPAANPGRVIQGVGFSLICQAVVVIGALLLDGSAAKLIGVGLWGLLQWFIALPWIISLKRQGRHQTARGFQIVSLIGLVLDLCGLFYFVFMFKLNTGY